MAYCQSQDHQLFILNEAEQTVISNAIPPLSAPVGRQALAVGNPANATQYLQLGLRSFSMSPQNLLEAKKALLEADALPEEEELE